MARRRWSRRRRRISAPRGTDPEESSPDRVRAAQDPALAVARELGRRHPEMRVRVLVCDAPIGMNPKVNVLAQRMPHARNPRVLVSDSNVRVKPSFLRETAAHFADPTVGMVSNVIAGGIRGHVEWRGHRIRLGRHTRLLRPRAPAVAIAPQIDRSPA